MRLDTEHMHGVAGVVAGTPEIHRRRHAADEAGGAAQDVNPKGGVQGGVVDVGDQPREPLLLVVHGKTSNADHRPSMIAVPDVRLGAATGHARKLDDTTQRTGTTCQRTGTTWTTHRGAW